MRAVVLGGGGSKGSYEIGAWQALIELGIDYDLVVGSSVGALNGSFMVMKDFNRAKQLWDTIKVSDVMEGELVNRYNLEGLLLGSDSIVPFVKNYLTHGGLDIAPLKQLIKTEVDSDLLHNSSISFGITMTEFPRLKKVEQMLDNVEPELIPSYLLASASCFPAFPVCRIGKKSYIDGGYSDNLPISFALKQGANEVIAIDLNHKVTHPTYQKDKRIHYIFPTRSLGSFLHFDHSVIQNNMILGYLDTMKSFHHLLGSRFSFFLKEEDFLDLELAFQQELDRVDKKYYPNTEETLTKYLSKGNSLKANQALFQNGMESAMEFFHFSPYRAYSYDQVIRYFRAFGNLSSNDQERGIFETIYTIYDIYRIIREYGQMYLLKFLYYLLEKDRFSETFILKFLRVFKEEMAAVIFLLVIQKKNSLLL